MFCRRLSRTARLYLTGLKVGGKVAIVIVYSVVTMTGGNNVVIVAVHVLFWIALVPID